MVRSKMRTRMIIRQAICKTLRHIGLKNHHIFLKANNKKDEKGSLKEVLMEKGLRF